MEKKKKLYLKYLAIILAIAVINGMICAGIIYVNSKPIIIPSFFIPINIGILVMIVLIYIFAISGEVLYENSGKDIYFYFFCLIMILLNIFLACVTNKVHKEEYIINAKTKDIQQAKWEGYLFLPYEGIGEIPTVTDPYKVKKDVWMLTNDMEKIELYLDITSYFTWNERQIKNQINKEILNETTKRIMDKKLIGELVQASIKELEKRMISRKKSEWTIQDIQKELKSVSEMLSTPDIHLIINLNLSSINR